MDTLHPRALRQLPGEGMLSPAVADEQYAQLLAGGRHFRNRMPRRRLAATQVKSSTVQGNFSAATRQRCGCARAAMTYLGWGLGFGGGFCTATDTDTMTHAPPRSGPSLACERSGRERAVSSSSTRCPTTEEVVGIEATFSH